MTSDKKRTILSDRFGDARGAYFTPPKAALLLHDLLDRHRPGWKSRPVWDPAAGTGALEADADFDNLFLSTIDADDVEVLRQRYPAAMVFQFDFVNDNPQTLPRALLQAIEDQSLLWLMNPPYQGRPGPTVYGGQGDICERFIRHALLLSPSSDLAAITKAGIYRAPNSLPFRRTWHRRCVEAFCFPSTTFEGVTGEFPIIAALLEPGEDVNDPPINADDWPPPPSLAYDCVVFNLFAGHNHTSSWTATYKGCQHKIDNQFHPFKTGTFVHDWLHRNQAHATPESRAVLDAGRAVYEAFDRHRQQLDLVAWKIENDVPGWCQIRNALAAAGAAGDELQRVRAAVVALRRKIADAVYSFGFLPPDPLR
jgi:hypothetical protein